MTLKNNLIACMFGCLALPLSAQTSLVTPVDRPYTPTKGLQDRHIAMWQSHGLYYENGDGRWIWQRARMLETVEDKYTQSYVLPYLLPMLEKAGAYVMTPRERDPNPYEVVVDNDGALASSPYSEKNGKEAWGKGEGSGFAYKRAEYKDWENPFKEGTFRQIRSVKKEKDESVITWSPVIPASYRYAVYVSYHTVDGSTDKAVYTVHHKDGKTRFSVNQQMGGGTWIYLGTFDFDKGQEACVTLSNCTGKDGEIVTADAVRFGGGMGNIARACYGDSINGNGKKDRSTVVPVARSEWQPKLDIPYETSGYPRFLEAARYYMQWAGIPDSIYSPKHGINDYVDDYTDRGAWVNYLAGGSKMVPDVKGLGIPFDLSLAFHTDAGTVYGDSIIGTLGIYDSKRYFGQFADGTSREQNAAYCDSVMTNIVNDVRRLYEPKWTRRQMWDKPYFEAWMPRVPAMLLEFLSHENFADMRYGLDPRFRFSVSRSIYKGMLKFLSQRNGVPYVVQPLAPDHLKLQFRKGKVVLSWKAVSDPLEPTAEAKQYIVYKRVGNGSWDNGTVVKRNHLNIDVPSNTILSFRVASLNDGGESFPSEVVSVGMPANATAKPVLIVNGFQRISGPDDFVSSDDELAGFTFDTDDGVPDGIRIDLVGKQKEFRRSEPWMDDDAPGYGDSYSNYEKMVVKGNTFDYAALHGKALMNAGYGFISMSRDAFNELDKVNLNDDFSAIDLILGKQKQTRLGRPGVNPLEFKTFDKEMQKRLSDYCEKGGRLFVSGSYVATDLWCNPVAKADTADQNFAMKYLKYKFRNYQAAVEGEVKTVSSPLMNKRIDFTYYNKPNTESYCVESPDGIEPACPEAYTAFRYGENNLSAGIVFGGNATDKWKTVALGFPFESVREEAVRDELMKNIIEYLK